MLGLKICSFISFSLSPIINSVEQNIESQLKTRHPGLVEWFRMVEPPRIAGFFIPLLKKWSMEYVGSCCVARKIGFAIFPPLFIPSIEDALIELMNWSHENVEFWIGLAREKLAKAIRRERILHFGKKTRLFLFGMGIKDLDECFDFDYFECGSLFIYPKFSSLSYQLFMEVDYSDEIGWLDFYLAFPLDSIKREGGPNRCHPSKERDYFTSCFTVCYDVFSGFVHFSSSTQRTLKCRLVGILASRYTLTSCPEDY
ncbi:hypothetical protein AAG906_004068 [Vitis piasezkii]